MVDGGESCLPTNSARACLKPPLGHAAVRRFWTYPRTHATTHETTLALTLPVDPDTSSTSPTSTPFLEGGEGGTVVSVICSRWFINNRYSSEVSMVTERDFPAAQ